MTYMKPLTPELRRKINNAIDSQLSELKECQNTPYVSALRTGLIATKGLFHGLPDGFPVPIEKDEDDEMR